MPANVVPEMAEDHEVVVLTGEERPDSDDQPWEDRPILPSPGDARHVTDVLRAGISLRSMLADLDPDLVYTFIAFPYAPIARIALAGRDVPMYVTALGTYAVKPLSSLRRRWLLASAYRRAETVFCISEYTQSRIVDELGLSNTVVIPLGVDVDEFDNPEPSDEGYLLTVAAIKRRKGQDTALRAFARVADEFPDVDYKLAGPVHERTFQERLDGIVDSNDLGDRVEFLGKVPDDRLKELYANCRLFVLTPRVIDDNFEGSGLVYLEAAAYCKPAVGTRSGGVPTSIIDGETGLLGDEDDPNDVADALRELLADDERREHYGENAYQRIQDLTWEWYAGEVLSILKREEDPNDG